MTVQRTGSRSSTACQPVLRVETGPQMRTAPLPTGPPRRLLSAHNLDEGTDVTHCSARSGRARPEPPQDTGVSPIPAPIATALAASNGAGRHLVVACPPCHGLNGYRHAGQHAETTGASA